MARIVGAYGVSHGPLLTTPPEHWDQRAAADRRNARHAYRGAYYDFAALLAERNVDFGPQLDITTKTRRYDACQVGLAEVARRFATCGADIAIVLGNDQREVFKDEFTPAILIYAGTEIPNAYPNDAELARLETMGLALALHSHAIPGGATYCGAPAAAAALIDSLMAQNYDVAVSSALPEHAGHATAIPHAFGFIVRRIMNDEPPPLVPVFLNVGVAPNQPRLGRMISFGHALKRAIDELPAQLNVALLASGGLSHFTIDEEFDRDVIAAMLAGDEDKLASFPESWFWGNTCETKTLFPLVAAMNDAGRQMEIIDYVPCYRSEAGTGQAMIFASWN